MMDSPIDGQFALDMQGFSSLKSLSKTDPKRGLTAAAQQFEAMFIHQMLKGMRDTIPQDGMFGQSSQSQMYQGMMDQQWSQALSEKGIGIADMIVSSMSKHIEGKVQSTAPAFAAPVSLSPAQMRPIDRIEDAPAHMRDFVRHFAPLAQKVEEKYGVPAHLVMAQAALETGWGRYPIRSESGESSNNFFGIKAGSSWAGKTMTAVTHESKDGQLIETRAAFRAYETVDESFDDYGRMLSENPRYERVVGASAMTGAHHLKQAGYATDPDYASKLTKIIGKLQSLRDST